MNSNKEQTSKKRSVTIIGAGIGGLYSAWKLSKSGFNVTVIEKQNFVGGLSTSISEMGYKIDIGPHYVTLPKTSEITKEITDLMEDNIIEVPEIKNMYKSYFHGKFIDGFPTIYDAILSAGFKSILISAVSFVSAKLFSNKQSDNVNDYLISLYGEFLFENWCKPYLLQTVGDVDIPLEYAKQKFKPITFSKIIKKLFSKNKKFMNKPNQESNFGEYYFKEGIGHLSETLAKQIIKNNGKIILNADIKTISHEKSLKCIRYLQNEKLVEQTTNFIIYAVPPIITKKWFSINEKESKNMNLHSIMVFLFIDSPQIFDGWVLGIFDNHTPYFRIAQQSYLSKTVAPPEKSLLSVEIRSNDDDPLWEKNAQEISRLVELSLRKIGLLKHEKIDGSKVIKLRNVYPSNFQNLGSSKSGDIDFIKSVPHEFILGIKEIDSGRLISNDEQSDDNLSLGGIFTSIRESKNLTKKIISLS